MELVREHREAAGLSVRALADAAGVAASTVHRIERGTLQPTVDTLRQILQAAGARLSVDAVVDHRLNLVGLARAIAGDLDDGATAWPVRRAAELTRRFLAATADEQRRMIAANPPTTGDVRWDAFVAALAQWLAGRAGLGVPPWATQPDRYLTDGWWVTTMDSMRAWEYAGSPAAFQQHGVYLHRDSLENV